MPTAYPYLRVSHKDSASSGLSPGSQLDICRRHYHHYVEPKGVDWWGLTEIPPNLNLWECHDDLDLIYDPAVSARDIPLLHRRAGMRLNNLLKPGDHVIFAHLDRGFRAVRDFAVLIHMWKSRDITVHLADMQLDLSTPSGMLSAHIMAAVAQGQSDLLSERNKEIAERMRRLNRPRNGQKMLGFKLNGTRGLPRNQWQLTPDWPQRAIMAEIVRLRDEERLTFQAISDSIERRICERDGRQFRQSAFFKRKWAPSKCRRAYLAYKRIVEEELARDGHGPVSHELLSTLPWPV